MNPRRELAKAFTTGFAMKVSAHNGQGESPRSWFKAIRGIDATELIKANKNAFLLLYIIAYRAQRTNAFNQYNLKPGEALIGVVI